MKTPHENHTGRARSPLRAEALVAPRRRARSDAPYQNQP